MSDARATFLDVEDDDQRQKRIGTLLERLDTSTASPRTPDIAHPHTPAPAGPPTELLARVQAFLPAIAASNEALSRQKPEDIDIEHLGAGEAQHIEMNLGLGVFEMRPRRTSNARSPSPSSEMDSTSDTSSSDSESVSHDDDSDESSSLNSDDDTVSDSDSGSSVNMRPIASRPIKPLPRRVAESTKLEV